MKITAGMGGVEDYEMLVRAGAEEVFCGFVPHAWNQKCRNILPLNRREVLFYHVQIGTLVDMRILKKKMDVLKVPVVITMNALYYTPEQLTEVVRIIKDLLSIGFSEYIVADLNLLRRIKEEDLPCKIHISGELGEWNSASIQFFKEEFGPVKRIIFHRKCDFAQMQSCIQTARKIGFCEEFEAFCMNEKCHFTGGFCNSLHCDEMIHLCQEEYRLACIDGEEDAVITAFSKRESFEIDERIPGATGCGLCAIKDLRNVGITHLKIVGRGAPAAQITRDIELVKKMLQHPAKPENCSQNCYYQI